MRSVPLNLVLSLGLSACASHSAAPRPAAIPGPVASPTAAAPVAVVAADGFRADVRPVLQRRCTPCHEPGGVMYGRMPFDQPETIRGHREGVLRRLKGDEHAVVASWLESN